ncbi:hypothetical protein ACFSBX_18960 [Halobellus rarus]|uniref:Abortive infection protein-like C-terminal domain-containing protein n=1 Tax=Halobellus rarus TaxID=1126237 RepID=A0ABD6CUK9_9EURY
MTDSSDDAEKVEEPSEGQEIRDLTISDAYKLGQNILYLQFAGEYNYPVGSVESDGILNSLEDIQNRLIATNTSTTVASQIEDVKASIVEQYGRSDPTTNIEDEIGSQLSQRASTWSQLMAEELAEETRINIPNAWILDFERLMYEPKLLFETEVWDVMDEQSQRDIAEACRALPVGCATASVMVSMRAVERYLRKWYEYEMDEELERGTWGRVLDDLIEIYISDEDAEGRVLQQLSSVPSVLSNIYYLKERRDKVSHPDESPTDYDAVVTLFMVVSTISEVCREMGDLESGGRQMGPE